MIKFNDDAREKMKSIIAVGLKEYQYLAALN